MLRSSAPLRASVARLAAPALVLGLALSGCSSTGDTATLAARADGDSLGTAVPPDRALAVLPAEAGAVVSVVERHTGDGEIRQTITLAGDSRVRGEDRIEVVRRPPGKGVAPQRLDAETLQSEMADALPGIAMTVSSRVITTAGGPVVGVATGSTGDGLACLYAWSNGEAHRASAGETLLGLRFDETPKTSVRVRLCRRATSPDRLVALAEGLRLTNGASASAVSSARLAPAVGSDALAAAGYGEPTVAPAPVVEPAAVPTRRAAAPAKTSHPPVAPTRDARVERAPTPPATVAAPIPLPSGG